MVGACGVAMATIGITGTFVYIRAEVTITNEPRVTRTSVASRDIVAASVGVAGISP